MTSYRKKLPGDDIMYEIYVRKKIENALKAVEEGKVVSHEEVKKRLLKQ